MKLKMVARKSHQSMGYDFYIYAEDEHGEIYPAEHMDIVIKKDAANPSSYTLPTFAIARGCEVDFSDLSPSVEQAVIDNLKENKTEHIANLNNILERFLPQDKTTRHDGEA